MNNFTQIKLTTLKKWIKSLKDKYYQKSLKNKQLT